MNLQEALRRQADFEEAESIHGRGSTTRRLMREAADALDVAVAALADIKAQSDAYGLRAAAALKALEPAPKPTWPLPPAPFNPEGKQ